MNIYSLESFISFCDDMMIVEEGFNIPDTLFSRLSRNKDLINSYDDEINDLILGIQNRETDYRGRGRISNHAYDMHVTFSNSNLSRKSNYYDDKEEPIVSYYGTKRNLEIVTIAVIKKNRNKLRNFLDTRFRDVELDFEYKDFLGFGFYKDEKYRFKCARVVVSKDFDTGYLFVKTSYPIPYCGYRRNDLENDHDLFNIPTVMKVE